MDRIQLQAMTFRGRHGVRPAEREVAQDFVVDVEVECDLGQASQSDELADTIDYKLIYGITKEIIEGESRNLIEALAGAIADRVLELPRIESVAVRIAKRPASMLPLGAAAVHIYRTRA
ncbi:MAG: dihydroneopterin aldolase [Candidatus Dormibacterales bacterium]